jgi:ornithine decarboxylase
MARVFRVERHHSGVVSKGTLFKVLKYIDRGDLTTPVLLLDREKVHEKAGLIGSGIRNSRVFYAVKANPAEEVVRIIDGLGLGFEIASEGELEVLSSLGVSPDRIITSNPVKSFRFLEAAASYGVGYFAYDSEAEIEKMARLVPGRKVYVRLSVPNEGSEWPLSRKFGVEPDRALELLLKAAERGLDPVGITFHVGSQCTNVYSWLTAIYKARELWESAIKEGLTLRMLNIGGGYPISYTKGVVGVEEIEDQVDRVLRESFGDEVEVFIEPGRAVVGDGGVFISRVIGSASRGDERWVYLDVGVFNGMMESIGGIKYSYMAEDPGEDAPARHFTVGGPSCDSFDVMDKEVRLPEPEVGSLMLVLAAGAYTISYASEFNGFKVPETVLI